VRVKETPVTSITIVFIGVVIMLTVAYRKDVKVQQIAPTPPTIELKQSYEDSIINVLIPVLKEREGLRLTPYCTKGIYYIGYGHRQGVCPSVYVITEAQADSVLLNDLNKCKLELKRLYKKHIYNLFISGKPCI